MKNILVFITLITITAYTSQLFAQDCETINKYDLKGQITTAEGEPIESVVISLLKTDSTLIAYAITDNNGLFEIQTEYAGESIFCTNCIGYKPYKINVLVPITKPLNIVLKYDTYKLDEAVVVGKKPIATLTEDGNISFNVSQIRGNVSADITGILNRLPGVTASQKQGLTLNGQQATLYIDGRKQSFSGTQAINILKTMPVKTIDNVELISYTGASYEASTGPVINIVTTKRKEDGWNISLNGSGSVDRHNNWDGGGNAYVIARKGNINLYGMFDYYNGVTTYTQSDSTIYNTTNYLLEQRNAYSRGNTYSGMANIEWVIKQNHILNFNLYAYNEHLNSDITDNSLDKIYMNNGSSLKDGHTHDLLFSGTVDYAATFNDDFKFRVSYGIIYGGNKHLDTYQLRDNTYDCRTLSDLLHTRGTQHIIKSDLTKQFEKTVLTVGTKIDLGNLQHEVAYSGDRPSWIESNNNFRARENIYAIYANITYKFNNMFSMNGGLRGEFTDYETYNITANLDGSNSYFNLFPSLSFTHRAKNVHQTLYFISGIVRPNYDYLYPGMRYETEYSYSTGNPNLKPTKAYSIKYVGYYWTYARFALGYQRTIDSFTRVLQLQDHNLTSYTYINYADQNLYFAEFTIPFAFFKEKLYGNINVEVNYSQLTNPKNGYSIPYTKTDFWNTKISGYVQYDITDRLSLGGQFAYYPKRTTAQYIQKPYWWLDFSVDYYLTKQKNWLISLSIEDVANKLSYKQTYYYSNSIKFRHTKSATQLVRFRLTWKFGGGEKQKSEPRSISNDVGRFRE